MFVKYFLRFLLAIYLGPLYTKRKGRSSGHDLFEYEVIR